MHTALMLSNPQMMQVVRTRSRQSVIRVSKIFVKEVSLYKAKKLTRGIYVGGSLSQRDFDPEKQNRTRYLFTTIKNYFAKTKKTVTIIET